MELSHNRSICWSLVEAPLTTKRTIAGISMLLEWLFGQRNCASRCFRANDSPWALRILQICIRILHVQSAERGWEAPCIREFSAYGRVDGSQQEFSGDRCNRGILRRRIRKLEPSTGTTDNCGEVSMSSGFPLRQSRNLPMWNRFRDGPEQSKRAILRQVQAPHSNE